MLPGEGKATIPHLRHEELVAHIRETTPMVHKAVGQNLTQASKLMQPCQKQPFTERSLVNLASLTTLGKVASSEDDHVLKTYRRVQQKTQELQKCIQLVSQA